MTFLENKISAEESLDFEEEIEFTRLKRLSTEYSNIGGVRD
jgi:hypothetical protein